MPKPLKTADEIAQQPIAERTERLLRGLAIYHNHRVVGLERFPSGGCLVAVNHSLATYDFGLLALRIYQHTGRVPRCLGDRAIFQTPLISDFADAIGVVQGSPETAERLLALGETVLVAPGGMREALRPSSQAYELSWLGRKGFARLAIRAKVPVVLAACPRADDIFTVYENPITKAVYNRFKFPAPLVRGFGFSTIPRPVRLTHWLSPPISPPPESSSPDQGGDHFYQELVATMESMMKRGSKSVF